MHKILALIMTVLLLTGCSWKGPFSDSEGLVSWAIERLTAREVNVDVKEIPDPVHTAAAVPPPIQTPIPTMELEQDPTLEPASTSESVKTPSPKPVSAPKPTPSPTVRPATPKPAATPQATKAPEPQYLQSMAKDALKAANSSRSVNLVWHSDLETIVKQRAKQAYEAGKPELPDPKPAIESAGIFYRAYTYGQIYYSGWSISDLTEQDIVHAFSNALQDARYNSAAIGIYVGEKGIVAAIIAADTYVPAGSFLSVVEQEILKLTNQERRKAGLPDLIWHNAAHKVARDKVFEMYTHDYFDHDSPITGSLKQQFEVFGGLILNQNVTTLGENLAFAKWYSQDQLTAAFFVSGWMNSDGHRKNILNPAYTHMGVGVYYGADTRAYAAQAFCTPK